MTLRAGYVAEGLCGAEYDVDPALNTTPGHALGSPTLATTSTSGFAHIPVVAGAPTGVPTLVTGRVPMCWDSTNNKLWVYINGAWKGVVVA